MSIAIQGGTPNALISDSPDEQSNGRSSVERLEFLRKSIFPLTEAYTDQSGDTIQLWSVPGPKLAAIIKKSDGSVRFVYQIKNALNPQDDPVTLHNRLFSAPLTCKWRFSFGDDKILTVWPYLCAEGWHRAIPRSREDQSGLTRLARGKTQEQMCGWFYTNGYKTVNLKKGTSIELHLRDGGYAGTYRADEHETIQNLLRQGGYVKEVHHAPSEPDAQIFDGKGLVFQHPKDRHQSTFNIDFSKAINEKGEMDAEEEGGYHIDVKSELYKGKSKIRISTKETYDSNYQARNEGKEKSYKLQAYLVSRSPASAQFKENLQKTGLTDSYNSTHQGNPVPPKGARGGDIGGVACSTDYIEGLFDQPEALFENKHFFCVDGLPDGQKPFSDQELQQILRELAIGVYVHSTIPFFSLHFNQSADMYPVIHPVYENTLVGRVISMLDFIMKGYLNGGVFEEDFVDKWHENPDWNKKEKSSLQQLIDFKEHCQNLPGVSGHYLSLRDFQAIMTNSRFSKFKEEMLGKLGLLHPESEALKNFTGFSNSFRIIAKQKSIQKKGGLFFIDSDFDVEYTINPSPAYKAALDEHMRTYGAPPLSYICLEESYKEFSKRIHDHMSKIPLCRNYFAMLSIINFFSGYFSTLKRHRKIPVLPPLKSIAYNGCPPLFPHLPINSHFNESLKMNFQKAFSTVISEHQSEFQNYFFSQYKNKLNRQPIMDSEERLEIVSLVRNGLAENLLANSDSSLKRLLEPKVKSPQLQEIIHELAKQILMLFDKHLDEVYKILNENERDIQKIPEIFLKEEILKIVQSFIQQDHELIKDYLKSLWMDHFYASHTSEQKKTALLEKLRVKVERYYPQSHLLDTQIAAIANIIFEIIEECFKSRIEERFKSRIGGTARLTLSSFLEGVPDGDRVISEIVISGIRVKSEMRAEEIESGKRVVGGCGMKLERLVVQTSALALNLFRINWFRLQKMNSETWNGIIFGIGNRRGYGFRLDFEEARTNSSNDYSWMESILLPSSEAKENTSELRSQLQNHMANGRKQEFAELATINAKKLSKARDYYGRHLMHLAASQSDSYYVEALAKAGMSIYKRDIQGYEPAHYAAMTGAIDTFQELLKHGNAEDILNPKSKNQSTPLIVAIQHNQTSMVQFLLSLGSVSHRLSDGYTPLHCALHQGNMEIIHELLSDAKVVEACLNESCEDGGTPLMLACELDSAPLIARMLALHANPNIRRKDGVAALEIALRRNCLPVIQEILTKSQMTPEAIEEAAKECSTDVLKSLVVQPGFYEHKNSYGDTALHTAIRFGHLQGALVIIRECKNVDYFNIVNQGEETPFSLAASLGFWRLIEEIFDRGGADLSSKCTNMLLKIDYSPILKKIFNHSSFNTQQLIEFALVAAQAGNHLALSFIFRPKKDVLEGVVGPRGWTLSHYLAKCDGIMLFRNQVNKENCILQPLTEDGNRTLPYIAATHHSLRVFRFLLQEMKNNNISLNNHYNDRHLLYGAIESADVKTVALFLEIYSEEQTELVNTALDDSEKRPLHLAAKMGSLPLIKLFLERGAVISACDKRGDNVLTYALKLGDEDIVTYLLKESPALINGSSLFAAANGKNNELYAVLMNFCRNPGVLAEALFISIQNHRFSAFTKLYKSQAPLTYVAANDHSILSLACETGQSEVVRTILSDSRFQDIPKQKAMTSALKKKFPQIALMLKESGFELTERQVAFIDAKSRENLWFGVLGDQRDFLFEKISLFSNELLKDELDYAKIIRIISESPLNEVIQIDHEGVLIWGTPLQLLLRFRKESIDEKKIRVILEINGINPNIQDSDGNTLAHLLVKANISPLCVKGVDLSLCNTKGQTPFHLAARLSSPKILKDLLGSENAFQIIELRDDEGQTPIYYAIEADSKSNINELADFGVDLNIFDNCLVTPLILALISSPSLLILKKLLAAHANPNQFGTTQHIYPIHLTFEFKQDELTRCLLMFGADCKVKTGDGVSLMHFAAHSGRIHLQNLLVSKGLSVTESDSRGMLPIHYAAREGCTEAVKAIMAVQEDAVNAPIAVPDNASDTSQCLSSGAAALHFASGVNQTETIQFLLDHGAQTASLEKNTTNPFSFAAATASKATLELYSSYRVSHDPEILCNAAKNAIISDNLDAVIYLYKKGVPINAELAPGFTGLHLAARFGSLLSTEWLLHHNADPFHPSLTGQDSLQLSAANSSVQQFALMLDFIDPDLDDIRGHKETLLHTAIKAGNMNHVMLLLKNYADLNMKNLKGDTPLHVAVQYKRDQITSLLLACGADATIKNGVGKSLIELVDEEDHMTRKMLEDFSILSGKSSEMGDHPIHLAIRSQNPQALLLVPLLGTINELNGEGEAPLHLAARMGYIEACMNLLQAEACIDILNPLLQTPLRLACMTSFETAEFLIRCNADRNTVDINGVTTLEAVNESNLPWKEELMELLSYQGS